MEIKFEDEQLERLERDSNFDAGFDRSVVKKFRMRIQFIRSAPDERTFYSMKSLHYEKLKGDLDGYHSMRLNDQWRLIIKIIKDEIGKLVVVISISDYH
ncbi:type II toxin-antitoxin system RelE/ParE family toxin [Methylomonas sp. AM2-LC]|uniref:type II toxin-antitoxin system RelE/ParE family toxin n=1 Tax=Methylomonas sp. AM2-LC TaxID=3153301 RepID=UPI003263EBC1